MKILDKYILKKFLGAFVFSLMALALIFVIVNLMENLDDFIDAKTPVKIVAQYYLNFLPEIIKLLAPMSMLLGVLFSIGRLSTQNEITAMKTGGMSVTRLLAPLTALSLLISCGHYYFSGYVVPKANRTTKFIERKYLKKNDKGSAIFNQYYRDAPLRNFYMQFYDASAKNGTLAAIEDFTDELKPRLKKRIDAERIEWIEKTKNWRLENVLIREFDSTGEKVTRLNDLVVDLNTKHDQIVKFQYSWKELTFDELEEYVDMLKRGGKDARVLDIDYHGQKTYPLANFIVILFGVPFASIKRKGGIAVQIGAAMAVSLLYLLFTKISQTIGYSTDYSPALIAWSANIIFFIAGLFVLWRTRT